MLLNLHVKNLALIESIHVEFAEGLNILTGETGAGKSIVIDSINMALGQKVPKDIIRKGAEYAYIELLFWVSDPDKQKQLQQAEVELAEDHLLIISRKIMKNRSVSKVNDETVTLSKLRSITNLLIDIHGQHEHQSLLYKAKHLEILDAYMSSQTTSKKEEIKNLYVHYQELKQKIGTLSLDQESRKREYDFCLFEITEIENANLKPGEEEMLTEKYRFYANAQKITKALSNAYTIILRSGVDQALKEVGQIVDFDPKIKSMQEQLLDADVILADVSREITGYIEMNVMDEEAFQEMEERLDLIHHLQAKYGGSIENILAELEVKKKRQAELENYDQIKQQTEQEFLAIEDKLKKNCQQLSKVRKKFATELTNKIALKLRDLNFNDVVYQMEFSQLDHYTSNGFDEVEFLISTNPGEVPKALGMVASGGELSRMMLAIKTVLAEADQIDTLIFDEIDTGISGRTAQKVSEQLACLSRIHQVICITHLPQIAAMADQHYEIIKMVENKQTITMINQLSDQQSIEELARLLGGVKITPAVMQNAREMKDLAIRTKNDI